MNKYMKTKNYQSYDRWMREKKVGRPIQGWVWDVKPIEDGYKGCGHWEHIEI
jgi:hypothetical protein